MMLHSISGANGLAGASNTSVALHPRTRIRKHSEDGFILLGVLILLAIFIIAMAAAAPKIAADIQRDRDLETMHRGQQYVRAIQLYYHKFNAYPPNLDALVKTNDIRFLRKKYTDPTTGKVDWKPIMFCQNKTPMAMGFFGQPLGVPGCGAGIGTGPGGMNGNPLQGGTGVGTGSQTNGTSSIFSNSSNGGAQAGGGLFSNPTSPTAGSGTGDQSGNGGSTGLTDANGNPIQGQTFGGGGIIGVSPASPKKSIYVYKKKDHYNEWEFLYSPLQEVKQLPGGGGINGGGQNGGGMNGGGFNGGLNGGGFNGGFNGGGGYGPGGNGGSTPIQPTPAPPSQPSPQ